MNEAAKKPDLKIVPNPDGTDGQTKADAPAADASAQGFTKRAGKVIERFGIKFIKKAGRPRLDGLPGKGDEIISNVSPSAPVPGTVVGASLDPSLDTAFIEDCLKAATQGLVEMGNGKIRRLALQVTSTAEMPKGDKEYANKLIEATTPSEPELARVAKLEAILVKKYQIDLRYLPEFALAFCVIGIGSRYMTALGELKAMLPDEQDLKIVGQGRDE